MNEEQQTTERREVVEQMEMPQLSMKLLGRTLKCLGAPWRCV